MRAVHGEGVGDVGVLPFFELVGLTRGGQGQLDELLRRFVLGVGVDDRPGHLIQTVGVVLEDVLDQVLAVFEGPLGILGPTDQQRELLGREDRLYGRVGLDGPVEECDHSFHVVLFTGPDEFLLKLQEGLLAGHCRLTLGDRGLEVEFAGDDLFQRSLHAHGMADPGDLAFAVDDERGGNAFLTGRFHPGLGHRPVGRLGAVGHGVHGDPILHLVAHPLDERLHFIGVVFPDAHADERDVFVFRLQLREVGDAHAARAAPGGPELDDVGLARLEGPDGPSLDELPHDQLGCRVSHPQILGRNTSHDPKCQTEGEQSADHVSPPDGTNVADTARRAAVPFEVGSAWTTF